MEVEPNTKLSDFSTTQDFPQHHVLFYDMSPILENHTKFSGAIRDLSVALLSIAQESKRPIFPHLAAIDARGFVLAPPLCMMHGVGMLMVRKQGKLPRPKATIPVQAGTQYGPVHYLEVNQRGVGGDVIIVDDVLATGHTMLAAFDALTLAGWNVQGVVALLELDDLGGREYITDRVDVSVKTILHA